MQPDWRAPDLLPAFDGERWAVIERGKLKRCDDFEVRNKLRHWAPSSPLVIAAPGYESFVSPIQVPEMRDAVWRAFRRNRLMAIAPFALLAIAELLKSLLLSDRDDIAWAATFGALAALLIHDYLIVLEDDDAIAERSRFNYWLANCASKAGAVIWIVLGLAAAGFQYWLMADTRSPTDVLRAVGVVHGEIVNGELWRLVSGPLIHTTLLHFLAPWLLLILTGFVSCALCGTGTSLITFFVGNAIGAFSQAVVGGPEALASASGMSFGLLALPGLVFGRGIACPDLLPRGMTTTSALLAIVFIAGAEAITPAAGTSGHLVAFALGGSAGLIPLIMSHHVMHRIR